MLTTAAIHLHGHRHVCSPIVLAIILFREFAVAGVRMIAAETGTVIAANMWGKVKTVLQMLTIIFYYFAVALAGRTELALSALPPWCSAGSAARYPALRLHRPVAESHAVHAGEVTAAAQ